MTSRNETIKKLKHWAKFQGNQKVANQIVERIVGDIYRLAIFGWAMDDDNFEMACEELNRQYEEELILELAGLD